MDTGKPRAAQKPINVGYHHNPRLTDCVYVASVGGKALEEGYNNGADWRIDRTGTVRGWIR